MTLCMACIVAIPIKGGLQHGPPSTGPTIKIPVEWEMQALLDGAHLQFKALVFGP